MIVKIQRPLDNTEPGPPALAYNQDRSYEEFLEFTDGLRNTIGDRSKIFVEAELKDGVLHVIREVKARAW